MTSPPRKPRASKAPSSATAPLAAAVPVVEQPSDAERREVVDDRPILELKNLGPSSAEWLSEVGVNTRNELVKLGALEAFIAVAKRQKGKGQPVPTLNLLFALEGAISDTHWARLPGPRRRELQEQGTRMLAEEGLG